MDPVTLALAKSWAEGQFGDLRQLQQHIAALQAVSELAPYIQAILDSRIVEHNLDVTNPPNGRYVRWENGLQVCWHNANEGVQSFSQSGALYTVGGTSPQNFLWTYPAAFAQTPIATGSFHRPLTDEFDGFVSIRTLGAGSMLYRYYSVVGGNWTAAQPANGYREVEVMRITYSPQRSDRSITYTFDGDRITATMDGVSDVFDFSGLPDGEAAGINSTLDPCPVLAARRVNGELHVTLLRTVGRRPSNPTELEVWRRLWTDVEEVR